MNRSIYQSQYYVVEETKNHEIIVHDLIPESASVVVLHQNCMMLVRQHREAIGEQTLELPGGTIKPGEEKIVAVQRELEEEAGILCGDIKYIGSAYPMASLTNRRIHFYFTDDVRQVTELRQDKDEDINPLWVPLRKVYREVREDRSNDSMIGHALMLCILHGLLKVD